MWYLLTWECRGMSRECGPLSALLRCLGKARVGMKRQEMNEQTGLLTWWLCSWGTWRASSPGAVWERGWRADSFLLSPLQFPHRLQSPSWGQGCSGPLGRSHTHSPCASRAPGQVASLWQGHKAGWRAGVPSNEVPPPGLCRMKIIPYSYTLHANINCLSHLFHT